MIAINGIQHKNSIRRSVTSALLLGLIVSPPLSINSAIAENTDPVVRKIDSVITASVLVSAPPTQAWEVLTRYESTALRMPDIRYVKIIERNGSKVKLQQTYKSSYTFGLKIPALLEVEEKGRSMINYQLIEGNLIKKLEGNWILIPTNDGTLIAHRIEIEPALPGFLKPLFASRFEKNLKNSMVILRQIILETPRVQPLEANQ